MKIIDVEIKGTSPLLQHRYAFKDEIEDSVKKRSGTVDYSKEWIKALYWSENIGVYQPASHLEGALIKASANFQIPGKRKKTYKDSFKSAVFIKPDCIPLNLKGTPEELLKEGKIILDRRSVVIIRSRVERLRPCINDWSLAFQIEIHDDQISPQAVKEILDYAGKFCGIGDFRPRFGRFMVSSFSV